MRVIPWSLFILSLVGFFDSLYLSWGALTGSPLICGILEGCNVVAQSSYSWVFGIPLAMYGVAYYIGALGLSASLLSAPFSGARLPMILWGVVGVLFSRLLPVSPGFRHRRVLHLRPYLCGDNGSSSRTCRFSSATSANLLCPCGG